MHAPDPDRPVRDVVADDYRAAAVFDRYRIDFCCNGHRSVGEACRDAGVSIDAVLTDLIGLASAGARYPRFSSWSEGFLIDYIVANHHAYVRAALPVVSAHTQKIAERHGTAHPELVEIARVFAGVAQEMTQHMMKEEHILFPYIRSLVAQHAQGCPAAPSPFGTVRNPIRMMEMEHQSAGDAMRRIRSLSRDYAVPDDACTSYRATLGELQEFEDDLHQHVHLENNILFPKALMLEEGVPS
jgi:regulator of cell morphogenesis and NO signaling